MAQLKSFWNTLANIMVPRRAGQTGDEPQLPQPPVPADPLHPINDPNVKYNAPVALPVAPSPTAAGYGALPPQLQQMEANQAPESAPNTLLTANSGYAPFKKFSSDDPRPVTEQLTDAMQNRPDRNPSFWNRLGSGIKQGVENWARAGAPGGIGGLIGAVGAGGTAGAASPGWLASSQQNNTVSTLWNRYQQQAKMAQSQLALQNAGYDSAAKKIGLQSDAEKLKQLQADPYIKSLDPKLVTPEERAYAMQQYGIDIAAKDTRPVTTQYQNGTPYSGYSEGPGAGAFVRNPTLPTIGSQQDESYTIPGGPTLALKPPQIAQQIATMTQQQAQRDQQTAETNAKSQLDADSRNASNALQFTNQRMGIVKQLLSSQQGQAANSGEVQAAQSKMARAVIEQQRWKDIYDGSGETTSEAQKGQYLKNLSAEADKYTAAEAELKKALAKQQGGQQIVDALDQQLNGLAPPPKVTYHPIQSVNPYNRSPKNNNIGTNADYQQQLRRIRGH